MRNPTRHICITTLFSLLPAPSWRKSRRRPSRNGISFLKPPSNRHLGPKAQDFMAAFGLGEDDRHISSSDADGVALAAIQGLNQKVEEQEARIRELKARLEELEQIINRKNGGVR